MGSRQFTMNNKCQLLFKRLLNRYFKLRFLCGNSNNRLNHHRISSNKMPYKEASMKKEESHFNSLQELHYQEVPANVEVWILRCHLHNNYQPTMICLQKEETFIQSLLVQLQGIEIEKSFSLQQLRGTNMSHTLQIIEFHLRESIMLRFHLSIPNIMRSFRLKDSKVTEIDLQTKMTSLCICRRFYTCWDLYVSSLLMVLRIHLLVLKSSFVFPI